MTEVKMEKARTTRNRECDCCVRLNEALVLGLVRY